MKVKKIIAVLIACLMLLGTSVSVFAQMKIFIDLEEVVSDTAPQIINDRTMVPVRAISEMLGYDVNWISEKEQVEICEKDSTTPVIIMNIGKTTAYYTKYVEELGDSVGAEAELDSPPVIVNDRTLVPLRFISEAVGYTVDYDVDTQDIYMFSPEYTENNETEGKGEDEEAGVGEVLPLSDSELEYLLSQTTNTWLEMTDDEKSEIVVLIGRWWEDCESIIVEDYDAMIQDLDHQMEQYFKNKVDNSVFETACDIYGVDITKYIVG